MKRVSAPAVLAMATLCLMPTMAARGFTIKTGITDPCHERVTAAGYLQAAVRLPQLDESLVPSGNWEKMVGYLLGDRAPDSKAERFILFSLLVGVRAPDGEGYSLTNVTALRAIQADPDGQYVHCLRAQEDNYAEGNGSAVAGCVDTIVEGLRKAAEFDPVHGQANSGNLIEVPFSLDSYGTFEVEVLATPYYLGRALHTFQDSFTHTLRSPDLRRIVHVMNYEAAIADTLEEHRDGIAHSAATDSCVVLPEETGDLVNRDRVFAAVEATADMVRAFTRYLELRQEDPDRPDKAEAEFQAVIDKWLQVADPAELGDYEECVEENDYCDSPWLDLARLEPAKPYLPCAVSQGGPGQQGTESELRLAPAAWLLCALGLIGRSALRRKRRRIP